MSLLLTAWTLGLILALLALGVFVTFRIFRFSDITVEGSLTLGASVSAALLTRGIDPFLATPAAFVAGMLAGATTGVLHTKFKINSFLAGILVMTALYTVNLRVMGKSNLPVGSAISLLTYAEKLSQLFTPAEGRVRLLGWEVPGKD